MSDVEISPKHHRFHISPGFISIGAPVLGALVGLSIGALLILVTGSNPIDAYWVMFKGAFGGTRQITETLLKTTPILLIGLGMTVAFRARVWNIGGEGQYFMGALLGGLIALYWTGLPQPLLWLVILLAGALGGMLWALIPAVFKIRFGMSEIISTLMLNYIATLLMMYLTRGPLQEPGGVLPVSAKFASITTLPVFPGTRVHLGVFLAFLLVPVIYVLLWKTPLGFRLRAVGSRASVAQYAGINVNRAILTALLISGGLAGIAGITEVLMIHTRLKGTISGGYGFSAILVALLGRMNPFGVLLASIFFAALIIGAETMHVLSGVPPELADAIQAVIVLSVLAVHAWTRLKGEA
ncbi:MAG TPA: ABC transporter permease [Anaerolineales bacterium]|nr:ABC transporter permease [Anaerolineales bacterium]